MATRTREDVQKIYSENAEGYDQVRLEDPRGQLVSSHDVRLFEQLFPNEPGEMRVVEIGAGTGRFTLPALKRNCNIIATDVNASMLERLANKVDEMGLSERCTVQTEDIFQLSFDDASVDYIFCIHVIPRFATVEDQRAAIRELSRILKPGGQLLFNYSNRSSMYGFLYKGYSIRSSKMKAILSEANLSIQTQRGKWFLNRTLINRVPLFLGRIIAALDRCLSRFWSNCAWDVFVVAAKE